MESKQPGRKGRADEDDCAAREHREGHGFSEDECAPEHREGGDKKCHRHRLRRAHAQAAIVRLQRAAERAAAAASAADAQLARITELKNRFAQHVMAGEIDAPADDNARQVLDALAEIAPDDVFVISGGLFVQGLQTRALLLKGGR